MPHAVVSMMITRRSAPSRSAGRGCARTARSSALRASRNAVCLTRRLTTAPGRRGQAVVELAEALAERRVAVGVAALHVAEPLERLAERVRRAQQRTRNGL